MYVRTYVLYVLYVRTHVCTYICMYACMYVCTYICIYVCMYVCMYVYLLRQLLEKTKQVQCLKIKQKTETKMVVKEQQAKSCIAPYVNQTTDRDDKIHGPVALQLVRLFLLTSKHESILTSLINVDLLINVSSGTFVVEFSLHV